MALPAPNLDDRHFQDLVDDARRLVHQRCPGWSDNNISDPGITLIEAFATMVDQLIYRLNRVPDKNYIKFLELIGVEMRSPSAARGNVTFYLSAPQPQPVLVRAETEVATPRTDVQDPVVFTTISDLQIIPCHFLRAGAGTAAGEARDLTSALAGGGGFACFSTIPAVGDALLVGLSSAVPSCAVVLRFDCQVFGVGVRPDRPPLVWEAWTGAGWTACDVEYDSTKGLNQPGDVLVHLPENHEASILAHERAGWLRCRLIAPDDEQLLYTESPQIRSIAAFTIGGTTRIVHAEVVRDEEIGLSDGTPAQRFRLSRRPVVPWEEPSVLRAISDEGVSEWRQVEHFADTGPDERIFHLDAITGEIEMGPAVRQPDGLLRQYGATPERVHTCGSRPTGPAAAPAGTSRPAPSGCSRPVSRTCPGWRIGSPPSAERKPRACRTRSCAVRCCCARAGEP